MISCRFGGKSFGSDLPKAFGSTSHNFRGSGGGSYGSRGGRGGGFGGRGGSFGGSSGNRDKHDQPGRNLHKPKWDMSRLMPFEKNFYKEHPKVVSRGQVNNVH